jgi:hypothetical protein
MEDTYDADQAGIRLPPVSQSRLIARDEAEKAILQHQHACPFVTFDVEARLRKTEISLARLLGIVASAAFFGSIFGGLIGKLLR